MFLTLARIASWSPAFVSIFFSEPCIQVIPMSNKTRYRSDFGSCECPFQTIGKRFFHNLCSGAAQERFGGFSAD